MYLFWKWLHIVAIISWMAGILYLYRLLIYHTERGRDNQDIHDLLALMEKRLYKYITIPAMVVSWIAGLSMIAINQVLLTQVWLISKLAFVILLTGSTLYAGKVLKSFAKKQDPYLSGKTLRILNEVPTLLMMIIVAMVIFRPF
ncbi:MAG: CopD family protein [Oligoflexales bacterium]